MTGIIISVDEKTLELWPMKEIKKQTEKIPTTRMLNKQGIGTAI